jgi:hypothetical protein
LLSVASNCGGIQGLLWRDELVSNITVSVRVRPFNQPLERVTALDRRHTHSVPAVAAAAPTLLNAFATREHGYSTLNRYFDGGRPVLPQLAFEAAHLQGEDG